jgi:hypothetical protein
MSVQFLIGILYGSIKNQGDLIVRWSTLVEIFVDGKSIMGSADQQWRYAA